MIKLDFSAVTAQFQDILSADWQQSQDRGWHRAKRDSLTPQNLMFLSDCNQHFGYNVKPGTSPTLGNTIIIDQQQVSFGEYRQPANAAFISAFNQIEAKQHKIEMAASALATHAWLQDLYHDNGVGQQWGSWELGFNPSAFNAYRISKTPAEAAFLSTAHEIIKRQANKVDARAPELSIYTENRNSYLKIASGSNSKDLLPPLRETLTDMIVTAKNVPSEDVRSVLHGKQIQAIKNLDL